MIKEWQKKTEETALAARQQEQDKAKQQLSRTIADYNQRIEGMDRTIRELQQSILEHKTVITTKDEVIESKNSVIDKRESQCREYEAEIKRLQELISQSGNESSELGKLLAATQKQLFEAEERINKLMAEVNAGQDMIKKLESEIAQLKNQHLTYKTSAEKEISDLKAEG